jgi:ribonucleoside-diphosphate reductase alpha chain
MENPKLSKLKRPKTTQGSTVRIETGCGHLYITIGRDGDKIIEVFAVLG